jgi:single-strand DNA-binding protein
MADCTITVVGNLTKDPELRFTTGGAAIASFGLAVNKRFQRNGEWTEETSFFNVSAWAQLGENVAASLTKGSRVIVYGELKQREYEDRDGNKRSTVEINAQAVGPDLRWAEAQVHRNARDEQPKVTRERVVPDEEPF